MIIFIKYNEVVTEDKTTLSEDTYNNLITEGYQEVEIPDSILDFSNIKFKDFSFDGIKYFYSKNLDN
jgi:hypothetical protein